MLSDCSACMKAPRFSLGSKAKMFSADPIVSVCAPDPLFVVELMGDC